MNFVIGVNTATEFSISDTVNIYMYLTRMP